jgi:signal transduction histidine kinase
MARLARAAAPGLLHRMTQRDLARNKVGLEVHFLARPFSRVNPAQIQQVLINLLINARPAMPEGASCGCGSILIRPADSPS